MSIHIQQAGQLHTAQMAQILSDIVQAGGTTALAKTVDGTDIAQWMARNSDRSAWHVAENDTGQVMGFQWIEPAAYIPPEAAEIATFAKMGQTGLGIGSKLFEATKRAAKHLGYAWINANIRADNTGGLAYYQSRGFEDYGKIEGYQMSDGTVVDKILKRYDLE